MPHTRRDPTPRSAPREDSELVAVDEVSDPPLKKASDVATWIRAVGAFGVGMFMFGAAAYTLAARVATKADLKTAKSEIAAQLTAHTAMPHAVVGGGPAITHRIDALESRMNVSDAQAQANQWWIRESITTLLRERGLRVPPITPPDHDTMSPAR